MQTVIVEFKPNGNPLWRSAAGGNAKNIQRFENVVDFDPDHYGFVFIEHYDKSKTYINPSEVATIVVEPGE